MTSELAHSFTMGLCDDPRCTALHFDLERRSGEHFATMTVAVETVPALIEKMKDLAYHIQVERKDY